MGRSQAFNFGQHRYWPGLLRGNRRRYPGFPPRVIVVHSACEKCPKRSQLSSCRAQTGFHHRVAKVASPSKKADKLFPNHIGHRASNRRGPSRLTLSLRLLSAVFDDLRDPACDGRDVPARLPRAFVAERPTVIKVPKISEIAKVDRPGAGFAAPAAFCKDFQIGRLLKRLPRRRGRAF